MRETQVGWRQATRWAAVAILLLLTAACTRSPGPPDAAEATATQTVENQVRSVAVEHTGLTVDRRDGPPPEIVELDEQAGRAQVVECVVTDDGTSGATTVLRRGDDGRWEATRSEPTDRCLPTGLNSAVEGWWQARSDWLSDPDPDHPLLEQHLTGAALDATRQLLGQWADRGWVGHTPGIVTTPWALRVVDGRITVDSCGPGGSVAAGPVGIEDTVDGSWEIEVTTLRNEAERASLTMAWTSEGWRVTEVDPTVGIEPAPEAACAQLCADNSQDWCVAEESTNG